MSERADLWHVPATNRFRWQCWGDEFIVYNVASGQTHYLNSFAKSILQYFEAEPGTVNELIAEIQMSGSITPGSPQSFCDQIPELINEFDALGLIARVLK